MAIKYILGLGPQTNQAVWDPKSNAPKEVVETTIGQGQKNVNDTKKATYGTPSGNGQIISVKNYDPVQQQNSNITASSQESTITFHSTLFEDFNLNAEPVYNFYTNDELTNSALDQSAELNSLPRYIKLTWSPSPLQRIAIQSRKGMNPSPAGKTSNPALTVNLAKTSVVNGFISPGVISALLVNPVQPKENIVKFHEDLFLSHPLAAGTNAVDAKNNSQFHVLPLPLSTNRIRVNFIDPSIAGALDSNRIAVSTDHTHLATLGALSKIMSGLEVISEFNQDVKSKNPAPSFPAPVETLSVMYTGYVIEKYILQSSGAMTLLKTFDIDDISQTKFIDKEVLFGAIYSYRIKCIAQWSRTPDVGFYGTSLIDRLPGFDTSLVGLSKKASFYSGDWSDWSKAEIVDNNLPSFPDELTIRPISTKKVIHINWKMPEDSQRDISSFVLVRSDVSNGRYSDWKQLGEFVPGNGMFIDTDVLPFEESHISYMYAMYSKTFHNEISVLSEKIEAKLTNKSKYNGEELLKLIGQSGDDPMSHAAGSKQLPITEIIVANKATIYCRGGQSSLPLFDRSYVVEVQSLSTGERVEINLAVDSTDVALTANTTSRLA
jgi:hypothetical protein